MHSFFAIGKGTVTTGIKPGSFRCICRFGRFDCVWHNLCVVSKKDESACSHTLGKTLLVPPVPWLSDSSNLRDVNSVYCW